MPSSYSTSLRFELQYTGESTNTWGEKLSNTLQRVDDAIAGYTAIALTANTYTVSSSNSNSSADEHRRAILKFTGTLTATGTITLPAVSKVYWIWNATTGGYGLTIASNGGGSSVSIDNGDMTVVFTDGTNVKTITFGTYELKDYIQTITASAGAVPGVTGNAGKFLYTDGATAMWRAALVTDFGDYETSIKGLQVALATAL